MKEEKEDQELDSKEIQPLTCFGFLYDSGDPECKECSLPSLCVGVSDGIVSWLIAYRLINSLVPRDEEEYKQKSLLLSHIKYVQNNFYGGWKREIKTTKKSKDIPFDEFDIPENKKPVYDELCKYIGKPDNVKVWKNPAKKDVTVYVTYKDFGFYINTDNSITITKLSARGAPIAKRISVTAVPLYINSEDTPKGYKETYIEEEEGEVIDE